jgi:tRNA 2-thiouridine synthesizing protein A
VPIEHDDIWDAAGASCGDLVMHLRVRLKRMPGKVLKVIAHDSGASKDIPAFCRMTGNPLVLHEPENDTYWIRAKE